MTHVLGGLLEGQSVAVRIELSGGPSDGYRSTFSDTMLSFQIDGEPSKQLHVKAASGDVPIAIYHKTMSLTNDGLLIYRFSEMVELETDR